MNIFPPSRTFALASAALGLLAMCGAGVAIGFLFALARGEDTKPYLDLAGTWVVTVGAVGGGGAGAMAIRDYGSRGLRTSQAALDRAGEPPMDSGGP